MKADLMLKMKLHKIVDSPFFKAVVLVCYMLHTVFRGLYNPSHRNMYKELILSPRLLLKKPKNHHTKRNLLAVPTSIKAACQKAFWVKLDRLSISVNIFRILGTVYLSEKMHTNIKFDPTDLLEGVFEDSMWICSEEHQCRGFKQFRNTDLCENYAKFAIPAEYGHEIISRLKIKETLLQQADEWVNSNLQGDWVSVHYRGTDASRRCIAIEAYIAYLKEVLDDQCSIFACSDQAQFIDQIKEAFPDRVFSREITRSYDSRPLHEGETYRSNQQAKDALIDILILSKTKLIYTTGSWFVDVVRFFNPAVKIISFELMHQRFKYHREIDNFIPIPQKNLLKNEFTYTRKGTPNLWCRFKALVVVGYALRIVLIEFYNNCRNPYMRLILFLRKGIEKQEPHIPDFQSTKDSIKAAEQKSLEVFPGNDSISITLFKIVGVTWFGEKMNINIKFSFTGLEDVFENSMLIHSEKHRNENPKQLREIALWRNYAKVAIPSEYGYKIISRLKIKEALLKQADEWVNSNLQGDWVSVHYRGTDRRDICRHRLMGTESYIAYLKEVLDDQCSIFACSDQSQFIEQVKEAFPGRVFSREITRSYDNRPLHRSTTYRGDQQVQDALIDILILSKTKLIYTTGSWFVDVVRFFNPAVKIISFDLIFTRFKYYRKIDNFIPIPKAHLLKKEVAYTRKGTLNLWCRFKALVVVGYALRIVLIELYNNCRNPYMRLILFLRKGIEQQEPHIPDFQSTKDSIKAADQKSLEVPLRSTSISNKLFLIIGVVWFGEKMNINIKFNFTGLEDVFENSMLIHSEKYRNENPERFRKAVLWKNYAKVAISSEYGYKIISKLEIKKRLLQEADEWVNSNLQGDWVSVHYRGTDAYRRFIPIEDYIAYLKEVLDDQCSIFACSDQAQFIDQIKEAFPDRVFSREITRSYDSRPLHEGETYRSNQQAKDALIDILILSKTKLIYTTGSWFVDVVRFFNPTVKIISFDLIFSGFKYLKKIDNFIPIPKAHLLKKD